MMTFDEALVSRLVWTLLHFLWQGFFVYGLFRIVDSAVRGRQARLRYAVALAAMVLMVAAPLLTWFWLTSDDPAVTLIATNSTELESTFAVVDAFVPDDSVIWQLPLLAVWLCGVTFFSGRLLCGLAGLTRWRRSRRALPIDWNGRVARLTHRLGLRMGERVFASRAVTEALAIGFFRPLVLIPAAWLSEMPVSVLEAVIAHELAHIRRGDLWINALQRIAESVLFYHPAVWWLSARIREEREMCCDDLAAAATGQQLEYARALEFVARRVAANRLLLAASFSGDEGMSILKRVRNVLGIVPAARQTLWWPAAALLLTASCCFIGTTSADEAPKVEDKERPATERLEPPRDGERRPDGPRDGDRRPDGPREGDRRPDGPPREGDRRPDGPREGDRDGDRRPMGPRDEPRGPEGRRPEGRRPEGEPGRPPREGHPPMHDGPPPGEADLRREVERLRREVADLRRELDRHREGRGRGEGDRPLPPPDRRPAGRPEGRPDGERLGDRPGDRRPPREGDRLDHPREGDRRPVGERPNEDRRPPREENRRPEQDGPKRPVAGERPAPPSDAAPADQPK